MSRNNVIIILFLSFALSSCIGPLYNPYPISKLVARVGPPLKIGKEVENEVPLIQENVESSSENIQKQSEETDQTNETVVTFSLDRVGSKRFGKATSNEFHMSPTLISFAFVVSPPECTKSGTLVVRKDAEYCSNAES